MKENNKLLERLEKHSGRDILNRFKRIDASLEILTANYHQLFRFIEFYKTEERYPEIVGDGTQNNYTTYLIEVTRLLHNFVAAVQSLIDHTRVYYRKFYHESNLFNDYQNMVDNSFKNNEKAVFVKDFRQYCQHYSIPHIFLNLTIEKDSSITFVLMLDKASLLNYSGWHSLSKSFISEQTDDINLEQLFFDYKQIVSDFQKWFRERELEINKEALDEYFELKQNVIQEETHKIICDSCKKPTLQLFELSMLRFFDRETRLEITGQPTSNNQRASCLIRHIEDFYKLSETQKTQIMHFYEQQ